MHEIDELVERSGALKHDLLAFARRPQFARALTQEIRRRFGEPVMAEEAELENFFDWFVQQYRRPDGRTLVDCFLDTRSDLPDHEREFVRGWRDVVEGMFEVTGRDGPTLIAVNVIDDLTYRIHANVGPSIFDAFPDGSFVLTRLVPVGADWLISGVSAAYGADTREDLLGIAARQAMEHPELVFRNPDRLARGWEIQRAERAAFVEHFGTDTVVLDVADLQHRLQDFAAARSYPDGWIAGILDPLHPDTRSIGLIYDETDGLGVYGDLGMVENAFTDPELVRDRLHRQILKTYLTDPSLSPVPLVRLVERHPGTADRVFRLLTGKPRFRWSDDGDQLLRRHKPDWYRHRPLPRTVVISDRLRPYVGTG